ncbi:hypothetical protein VT85_17435 [Planctomyces sp. SH-PL62]|nr:hypothetical protein VT85_17435 [Planctomyces sp. SH-PL62]
MARGLGEPVLGPEPAAERPLHFCAAKGYDYADVREVVELWGLTAHVKARGEEAAVPGYRARRWVVSGRLAGWIASADR